MSVELALFQLSPVDSPSSSATARKRQLRVADVAHRGKTATRCLERPDIWRSVVDLGSQLFVCSGYRPRGNPAAPAIVRPCTEGKTVSGVYCAVNGDTCLSVSELTRGRLVRQGSQVAVCMEGGLGFTSTDPFIKRRGCQGRRVGTC